MLAWILALLSNKVFGAAILALFAASESLASLPWVESNSVFQLARNILKWLKDKVSAV